MPFVGTHTHTQTKCWFERNYAKHFVGNNDTKISKVFHRREPSSKKLWVAKFYLPSSSTNFPKTTLEGNVPICIRDVLHLLQANCHWGSCVKLRNKWNLFYEKWSPRRLKAVSVGGNVKRNNSVLSVMELGIIESGVYCLNKAS